LCVFLEQIIKLEFLAFNVKYESRCDLDNVTVYDGPNKTAPSFAPLCGETVPGYVISANNTLYVDFASQTWILKNAFKIKYTAIDSSKLHS